MRFRFRLPYSLLPIPYSLFPIPYSPIRHGKMQDHAR